jgi:hypothetical protein
LELTKVPREQHNLVLSLSQPEREKLHTFINYVLEQRQSWLPRIFASYHNPIAASVDLADMLQVLEGQLR